MACSLCGSLEGTSIQAAESGIGESTYYMDILDHSGMRDDPGGKSLAREWLAGGFWRDNLPGLPLISKPTLPSGKAQLG
jgi:hypothetical protein